MTAQYFIDTNVLLYAGSGANEDQDLNHGQDYDGVKVVNPFLAVASA